MRKEETLSYYNQHAEAFVAQTVNVDFSEVQQRFLGYLEPGAQILDFGCGSGRDSAVFQKLGYQVEAIDGASRLCYMASELLGQRVRQMDFLAFDEKDNYDGIWACSSILHLTSKELPLVMEKLKEGMKCGGYLYCSFKYGAFEGMRNGRYFTDMTEDRMKVLLRKTGGLLVIEQFITGDARPGREEEKWFNIIMQKEK